LVAVTSRKKLRSIVFVDLDNTVMRGSFSHAVYGVACAKIAEAANLPVEKVRNLVAQENRERMQDPEMDARDAMNWDDIVSTVAESLGVSSPPSVLALVKDYAREPYIEELDQARQVLKRLQKSKRREIIAATNGLLRYQLPVLSALHLDDCFADILSPDRQGVLKDNIRFYENWADKAHLKIVVGDSYHYDVHESRKHGFKPIWYRSKSKAKTLEPSLGTADSVEDWRSAGRRVIDSLRELPRLVSRLERWTRWHRLLTRLQASLNHSTVADHVFTSDRDLSREWGTPPPKSHFAER
jgi:FMN phosphatase YigB (HAD superfamily)